MTISIIENFYSRYDLNFFANIIVFYIWMQKNPIKRKPGAKSSPYYILLQYYYQVLSMRFYFCYLI